MAGPIIPSYVIDAEDDTKPADGLEVAFGAPEIRALKTRVNDFNDVFDAFVISNGVALTDLFDELTIDYENADQVVVDAYTNADTLIVNNQNIVNNTLGGNINTNAQNIVLVDDKAIANAAALQLIPPNIPNWTTQTGALSTATNLFASEGKVRAYYDSITNANITNINLINTNLTNHLQSASAHSKGAVGLSNVENYNIADIPADINTTYASLRAIWRYLPQLIAVLLTPSLNTISEITSRSFKTNITVTNLSYLGESNGRDQYIITGDFALLPHLHPFITNLDQFPDPINILSFSTTSITIDINAGSSSTEILIRF